jgi:heme-degrading monooxygenase HmoA
VYARSTTIEAEPRSIDVGIAHMRDVVMPALSEIDGCLGMSLLVDRETGRSIATSSWETEKAMHGSAERVWPLRDRAAKKFGGRVAVDQWEIAVVHRDHRSGPGACVRATWVKMRPNWFDQAIDYFRMAMVPAIEELEGFCSTSLLIDPVSARAVASTTFDSVEAMARNQEQHRSLRTSQLRNLGVDQYDVAEFELALAHLRVPELV